MTGLASHTIFEVIVDSCCVAFPMAVWLGGKSSSRTCHACLLCSASSNLVNVLPIPFPGSFHQYNMNVVFPCAGLSVQSPLKAALTGLELVLARAQIWEESAAKHVSLAGELEGVAALATRWRRLELAAWRNLLNTTRSRHAAG